MAPHLTTVLTVARTGKDVVRYLIRPARPSRSGEPGGQLSGQLGEWGRDPWLPAPDPQQKWQRGASLTRRGLGLATLLVLAALGAVVLAVATLLLGIGAASGHAFAGWLLLLVLLAGAYGAYWTLRRASELLRARAEVPVEVPPRGEASPVSAANTLDTDEARLLTLLRTHERGLPGTLLPAFQATVIATRDALRLTAADAALQRDTFDARQAAREDLPELMSAYRAVPPSRQSDEQLLEQLALIERRMQSIVGQRAASRQRELSAHGRYLQDKYTVTPIKTAQAETVQERAKPVHERVK